MRGQITETQKRRGHCCLERKQVVFFWCCFNRVVLGQIQWRLASCHELSSQPTACSALGIVVSFLEAFKTPARALCYQGQALHTTENMLCLFKCSINRLRSLWTAVNSSRSVYPENRCNGSKGSALPQHTAGHQQQEEKGKTHRTREVWRINKAKMLIFQSAPTTQPLFIPEDKIPHSLLTVR